MHIAHLFGHGADSVFMDPALLDPVEAARLMEDEPDEDVVAISTKAREALQEAGQKDLVRQAMSLPKIQARIEAVRAEIVTVWDSALPDKEKYRLISAKENEIALLQAGQFEFAKAGFSMVA